MNIKSLNDSLYGFIILFGWLAFQMLFIAFWIALAVVVFNAAWKLL